MKNLKILRENRGITQRKCANDLNISKTALCYYEQGKISPSVDTIIQIADYFGCSVDYLVGHQMRDSTQGLTPAQKQLFYDIQKFDEADFMRVEAFVEGIKSAREEERKIKKRFLVEDDEA